VQTSVASQKTVIDGQTGLLVEPENNVQLAEAIIRLLEDMKLRQELGNNARYFVGKLDDWESVVQQYVDVYKQAIAHRLSLP